MIENPRPSRGFLLYCPTMLSLDKQNERRAQLQKIWPRWQPATAFFAAWTRDALAAAGSAARLLDVGCGRGGLVEQLEHPERQMVGIDPDFASLVEHRLDMNRAAAFSHQIPFAEGVFDVVIAAWVMEHLSRPSHDLAEIARVLKPGGRLILITPNRLHPLIRLNRILGRVMWTQKRLIFRLYGREAEDTFPAYYRANTPADLKELGRAVNLNITRMEIVPDPTYLAFSDRLFGWVCRLDKRVKPANQLHLVCEMTKMSETP